MTQSIHSAQRSVRRRRKDLLLGHLRGLASHYFGQNDIKKLRRENEQLRREIWGLREEYDRLEQLLGSLHPPAGEDSEEECEDGENAKNLQRANDGLSVVEEEPAGPGHPQEPTCLTFPVGGNLEQLLREVRGGDQSDTEGGRFISCCVYDFMWKLTCYEIRSYTLEFTFEGKLIHYVKKSVVPRTTAA